MRLDFWKMLYCLNRRAELLRLIQWAERKQLAGPLRCYQARLADVEIRLQRYAIHNPHLTRWTRRFHRLCRVLMPPPRYYRRGSAAGYRRNNLTNTYKTTYSYIT
jgi:hypothetical protein